MQTRRDNNAGSESTAPIWSEPCHKTVWHGVDASRAIDPGPDPWLTHRRHLDWNAKFAEARRTAERHLFPGRSLRKHEIVF